MRLVIFAYHDIGCAALETLITMGQTVCAVFTHQDNPSENVWFNSVEALAKKYNLPVFTPEDVNQPDWIKTVKELKPDAIFSFYYRQMICEDILSCAPKGAYNLHGSLLPKYRGRVPINWAIINGESQTGLTLHQMVKKPDAGDIAAQKKITIGLEDTARQVFAKMLPLTKEILLETVPKIEDGSVVLTAQDASQSSYFGGRKAQDGLINWTQSAWQIYNLIRATTHPYPGAFTVQNNKKIWIWQATLSAQSAPSQPGQWLAGQTLQVVCGDGKMLNVLRLQTEGQEEMDFKSWMQINPDKTRDM